MPALPNALFASRPRAAHSVSRGAARVFGAIALAALLGACATPIDRSTASPVAMPAQFAERSEAEAALDAEWWRRFGSAELAKNVEAALAASPDIAIAAERVVQAELALRSAGATLFPSLDLGASSGASGSDPGRGAGWSTGRSSSLSLGASYEIDLWGRLAAGVQGSRAFLASTRFDEEAVRLSLASSVAEAYFQILSLRVRLGVARENLAIAERVDGIVQIRERNGVASQLDLSRQRSTVLAQRAAIGPLQTQERQAVRALAILTGRVPEGFAVQAAELEGIALPAVSAGLPSDLLVRRPDLASAQANLAAADADVAVARASLLPSVSLSASGGLASAALLSLANPATSAALALSVSQSLFDGGRLRNQVAVGESQRRALVETYRAAIHTALKEVEDALAEVADSRAQEEAQRAIQQEALRALRLAELRYREGADDITTVLDAQRTFFSAQDSVALQRLARLLAAIDLFRALGGGWQAPPAEVVAGAR